MAFTGSSTGVLSVGNRVLQTVDAGVNWTPGRDLRGVGLFNFEFVSSTVGYAVGDQHRPPQDDRRRRDWNVVPVGLGHVEAG